MFANHLEIKDYLSTEEIVLNSTTDIVQLLSFLKRKHIEEVLLLTLNNQKKLLNIHILAMSNYSINLIDVKNLLYVLLAEKTMNFILVHNHPSGIAEASQSDYLFTNYLKKITSLLYINFLDHIIISEDNYYSFKEKGVL